MLSTSAEPELVVLCGEDGAAIGTELKSAVHHADTPLHLAFSCYLVDAAGRLLMTRRASSKKTWPSVRTNSCCGHPAPGEPLTHAVERRLVDELGVTPVSLRLIAPTFRYRARMADGIVENELCPVYLAVADTTDVHLNPAEVDDAWWESWTDFLAYDDPSDPLSPWSLEQRKALRDLGPEPLSWPTATSADLPAAASGPLPS